MIKPSSTTMVVFVKCPYCGAEPLRPCTWGDRFTQGMTIQSIHPARYQEGERAFRYPDEHPQANKLFRLAAGIVEIELADHAWRTGKQFDLKLKEA